MRLLIEPQNSRALTDFENTLKKDISRALQIPVEAIQITAVEPLSRCIIVHVQFNIRILSNNTLQNTEHERVAEQTIIQVQDETSNLHKGKLTSSLDPSFVPTLRILTEPEVVRDTKAGAGARAVKSDIRHNMKESLQNNEAIDQLDIKEDKNMMNVAIAHDDLEQRLSLIHI